MSVKTEAQIFIFLCSAIWPHQRARWLSEIQEALGDIKS